MSQVVALIYADINIPAEIYSEVRQLRSEGRIDLVDVTEVEIKDNGKLKFERAMSVPLVGKSDGLFLPAFVGLLFFGPKHTTRERVQRILNELSLSRSFAQRIVEESQPRNSVLFLYLKSNASPQTLARISQHGGALLQMPLSTLQEENLIQLFHGGGANFGDADQTILNSP